MTHSTIFRRIFMYIRDWCMTDVYIIRPFSGDIAEVRFCLLRSMLPFCGLSVCLSVCPVRALHCAQTTQDIETISFAQDSLSQIAIKFDFHRSTPSSLNFDPKWPTPIDLSVGTFDGKLRYSAMVTMEILEETTIALSNGTIADSLLPPSPKWGSEIIHTPGPASWRVVATDKYDWRYRQDFFFIRAMLPFAELLWPLFVWWL